MTIDPYYKNPDALVTVDWLACQIDWSTDRIRDDSYRLIESNEDILLYDSCHIPGAIHIDWRRDLQDDLVRDYIDPKLFAQLCEKHGITKETKCIFYGDKSNWWACYALWAFRLFGHTNVHILDGGREKWISSGRPVSQAVPNYKKSTYPIPSGIDENIRAFYDDTLSHSQQKKLLIDVRSVEEFVGELTHLPEYPQEGVLRGGHIPGAKNLPWKIAVKSDGTFKEYAELLKIYSCDNNNCDQDIIVYCRIGERSSHTWFVLHYLLGYKSVKNYDGSWTEWGNRVRAPIEKP